jgi:hypothetical protein
MFWLRSARYDLGWLILPIILVLALYPLDHASSAIVSTVALFSLLLSGIHVATNWTLLYRDRTFWQFDRMRYVHMGWLIIIGSIVLSSWNLSLFMSVYVYWGLWHFARQYWGIAMLYKAKAGISSRFDYQTDKILVHLLLFLPLLIQFARPGEFGFYTITLYRFYLPEWVAKLGIVVWWGALIVWLGFSFWRFIKGRLVIPFFLTILFAVISFGIIYFFVHSFLLMYALISIPHSLQYIGLAIHYHHGKNLHIKGWGRAKDRNFLFLYWAFTIGYTLIAAFLVKFNEQYHSPIIYGLLGLTIFHFWVELFSWRAKYNPELRKSLGL